MTGLHALLVLAALAGADPPGGAKESLAPADGVDVARLRELLHSRQQPQEQSQAALLLLQSQSPEAMDVVKEGLRAWDRPDVFQALAAAIRLRRDTQHVTSLLKALGAEEAPIRQTASETLARLDHRVVIRRLLAVAEDPKSSVLARQTAAHTLGRTMQKSAVVPLIGLLTSEAQPVRQAAASALTELTGQTHGTDLLRWQGWWQQYKDVSEEEWMQARTAYFADRARRLRDDLQRAENQILQLHRTLYNKTPLADRPNHFQTLLQNDYPSVRVQAVTWIAETLVEVDQADQKRLVDLLLTLSEDAAEPVQRQAALALEKVNDPRAFDRLIALLQGGSENVRAAAARSLGRHRSGKEQKELIARAVAALEKALGDSSLAVIAEAAESLGSLGAPETAPILAGLLRHPSDVIRPAAARALEQIAGPGIVPHLIAALDDPVAAVRFSVVGGLGRAGASGSMDEGPKSDLLKRLQVVLVRDSEPGVRSRAATVLGQLGTAAELPVLWQRVKAVEDHRVQQRAWTAMTDILSRSGDWNLVMQWDQKLTSEKEYSRRVEMLTEIRERWSQADGPKPNLDALTATLVQAQLAIRKWNLAMPLAYELAAKARTEVELQKCLRWLLVAGTQAVDDKKPREALDMLKSIEELLKRAGSDLAAEFDALRQRALQVQER